ncbi:MAG: hypothetical protein HQL89_13495 [Magnetococcales bacterium]|nr:hypothetical protein [Magnetococcales bacterium]
MSGISILSAGIASLYRSNNHKTLFLIGLLTTLPLLMRQTGLPLMIVAIFPILVSGITKHNLFRVAVICLGGSVGLLGLMMYNHLNFGKFTITSGNTSYLAPYLVYKLGPKFSEEFGPANKKLLKTIQEELLTKDVYVNAGVNIDNFIQYSDDELKYVDLLYLEFLYPGILGDATFEAIGARPVKFVKAMVTAMWRTFVFSGVDAIQLPDHVKHKEAKPRPEPAISAPYSWDPDIVKAMAPKLRDVPVDDQAIGKKVVQIHNKFYKYYRSGYFQHGEYVIYRVKIIVKYFMAEILPPLLFFLLACALLLFHLDEPEVRLLLTLLMPSLLIVIASIFISQITDYRAPFDFLIILGGVIGLQRLVRP